MLFNFSNGWIPMSDQNLFSQEEELKIATSVSLEKRIVHSSKQSNLSLSYTRK